MITIHKTDKDNRTVLFTGLPQKDPGDLAELRVDIDYTWNTGDGLRIDKAHALDAHVIPAIYEAFRVASQLEEALVNEKIAARERMEAGVEAVPLEHIVSGQASRIRDLISENVKLRKLCKESEEIIRSFCGKDPGACLTAHSEEGQALEVCEILKAWAEHSEKEKVTPPPQGIEEDLDDLDDRIQSIEQHLREDASSIEIESLKDTVNSLESRIERLEKDLNE